MEGKPRRTKVPKQLYSVDIQDARRSALQHGYLSQLRRMARILRQPSEEMNADGVLLTLRAIASYYRECAAIGFAEPAEFELEKEGLTRFIFKDTDQT